MLVDLSGWVAAAILLATLVLDIRARWVARSSVHLGPWIVAGRTCAAGGLLLYSALVGNAVFVAASTMFLTAAVFARAPDGGWRTRSRPVAAVRCGTCGAAITLRRGARGFETTSGMDFREKCRRRREAAQSVAIIAATDCPDMARSVARVAARLRREAGGQRR